MPILVTDCPSVVQGPVLRLLTSSLLHFSSNAQVTFTQKHSDVDSFEAEMMELRITNKLNVILT